MSATAEDDPAAAQDYPQDMDSYSEQPFMDDLDIPADILPEHSPDKQAGPAAEEPSVKHAADAVEALPASSSAADASKASADTAMPTPIAGKAMQQLVKSLHICSFPQGHAP